jgi:hypothetical protein
MRPSRPALPHQRFEAAHGRAARATARVDQAHSIFHLWTNADEVDHAGAARPSPTRFGRFAGFVGFMAWQEEPLANPDGTVGTNSVGASEGADRDFVIDGDLGKRLAGLDVVHPALRYPKLLTLSERISSPHPVRGQ